MPLPTPIRVFSFPVIRGAWERFCGNRLSASSGARSALQGAFPRRLGPNSLRPINRTSAGGGRLRYRSTSPG